MLKDPKELEIFNDGHTSYIDNNEKYVELFYLVKIYKIFIT